MERIDLQMSAALRSTTRPSSPTYAIWRLWDDLFRSGHIATLTPAEALTFHGLVHHMRVEEWVTWVSVERLTEILPIARCSIQRSIRSLTRRGWLLVEKRPGRSSLVTIRQDFLADLAGKGSRDEAPRGSIQAPEPSQRGRVVRPEQSKQIQNQVEQQTAPPPAVVAPSIDLPEDLVSFAESDKTIGRATVARLIERHGEERVRQAVEFIRSQYDGRGIRVLNRGGLLRTAAEQGFQTPEQIKEQEKAEKVASTERHRAPADATWGRSPSGRMLTVLEVGPDAVKLQDEKGRESMLPTWAMTGWVWGT